MKGKLFNFRPLLFLAVAVCLGILISYLVYTNQTALWVSILSVTIVILILFNLIYTRKTTAVKNVVFSCVFLLFFVISFFNFKTTIYDYEKPDAGGFTYSTSAVVCEVTEKDDYTAVIINDISVSGAYEGDLSHKGVLYVQGNINLKVGDKISFTTRIYDMDAFYEDRFSSWNVAGDIKYTANLSAEEISVLGNKANVFQKANMLIRDVLKSNLSSDDFSVAYAMFCGNSDFVDGDLLENYRSVGVAHIFAVSGLHIGFLALVLKFLLSKIKMNKFVRAFLIIFVLLFYSGVCGFSSSSIRATIMCGVSLIASAIGKKYDRLSSVSFALIIVLMIWPVQLFCVGFQLSFGVVFGIILLARPISRIFRFLPKKLSLSLSTVISAQLTSFPICLYAFKQFSSISIIANLIFIPIVGIIFILLFVSVILTLLTGSGGVFLFIPSYLLKGINWLFGVVDYKIFMVGGISLGVFGVIYYIALIIASPIVNLRRIPKTIIVILMCICTCVGTTQNTIKENKESYLYVTGSNTVSATIFDMPKTNVVVISSANYFLSVSRLIRTLNSSGEDTIDNLIIPSNANGEDVQIIMTKLLNSCAVENVYYLRDLTTNEHIVLEKNFPDTNFYKTDVKDTLSFDDLAVSFDKSGYATFCQYKDQNLLIVSKLGKNSHLLSSFDFDDVSIVIGHDYVDHLSVLFPTARIISCLKNPNYVDGEESGFFKLKIT